MADFIPVGLGYDAAGQVSGLREPGTGDFLPDSILGVANTAAKWNASALQGFAISSVTPINGQVLKYNGTVSAWVPNTDNTGSGGTAVADATSLNVGGYTVLLDPVIAASLANNILVYDGTYWTPSALPTTIASAINATNAQNATSATSALYAQQATTGFSVTGTLSADIVSATNYVNIPSGSPIWNANKLQGYDISAVAPTNDQVLKYNSTLSAWVPGTDNSGSGGGGGGGSTSAQYLTLAIDSTLTNERVFTVGAGLGASDAGANGNYTLSANYTSAIWQPSAIFGTSGQTVQTLGNFIVNQTLSAATVSATNYVNLPSSTAEWYSSYQAQRLVKYVKNGTASTLPKGTPVTVTGTTGDVANVAIISSVNNHVPEALGFANHTFGLVDSSISAGGFGYIVTEGLLSGTGSDPLNTNSFSGGDMLYVSSNGQLTNVRPPAPYESHPVGYVVRTQTNNGSIYVKIENATEINDIVGFNLASSLVNGDIITYDTTTSTFKNLQTVNVSGQGKFGSVSATSYFNLPSSTIVWASAGYATLAGSATSAFTAQNATSATTALNATSATSALNAKQAPAGFVVTGTMQATTVSGTTLNADSGIIKNTLDIASGVYSAPADSRLYVQGKSYFQNQLTVNSNLSVTGTASAVTVSATNYLNLPSSTIVWASAGYATLAGSATSAFTATNATSATSALNAQQAPAGFNVTGTMKAGAVSSTIVSADDVYVVNGITAAQINGTTYTGLPDVTGLTLGGASFEDPFSLPSENGPLVYDVFNGVWTTSAFKYFAAPIDSSYLTLSGVPGLANERVFTVGAGLSATDGGGGGNYTLSANYTSAIWQPSAIFGTAGQTVRTLGNFQIDQSLSALGAIVVTSALYGSGIPTGGVDGQIYLQYDVSSSDAPPDAQYLTLATNTSLTQERVLTAGAGLGSNDAGAGGNFTLSANYTSAIWQPSATFGTAGQTVTTLGDFKVNQTLLATSGDVSSTRLTDYSEKKSAPTISSSALTLDLNNSQVFTVSLNSNISTLTISNPDPRTNTAQGFTLILTADGTARTITWPASVKWPSGTGPTLTSTNNKVDILSFLSPDNGTTWYGFTGGQNF